jgi:hypothetical protein
MLTWEEKWMAFDHYSDGCSNHKHQNRAGSQSCDEKNQQCLPHPLNVPRIEIQRFSTGAKIHQLGQYEMQVTGWLIHINGVLQINFRLLILICEQSELPNGFIESVAYFIIDETKFFRASGGRLSKKQSQSEESMIPRVK